MKRILLTASFCLIPCVGFAQQMPPVTTAPPIVNPGNQQLPPEIVDLKGQFEAFATQFGNLGKVLDSIANRYLQDEMLIKRLHAESASLEGQLKYLRDTYSWVPKQSAAEPSSTPAEK